MIVATMMIAALQTVQEPAVAGASHHPTLRNPRAIITRDDYPEASLRRGESGVASILLRVSAEGKATSCDITESSGFATLDSATCSLFKFRARFNPSRDATNAAVTGEYRLSTAWIVNEHRPTTNIEFTLHVAALPSGYIGPVKAQALFDQAGRVKECEVTTTSGNEAADRTACAFARQQISISPPTAPSSGIPVVAVRYLTANLTAP